MENKIRVVIKEVDKPAVVKEIDNDYKVFQHVVGGLIGMTSLPNSEDIDIIFNDEYLLNGSKANVLLPEREHLLCGNVIFAGYEDEDGSTTGLSDEQLKQVLDYIEKNKVFNMDAAMAYFVMKEKKLFDEYINSKDMEAE